jgi:cyclopropane fatty-acyl-phospholipid synthase-like methyltransferase
MYAASHYGVDAFGITNSLNQAHLTWERIRNAGLKDHCAVRVCDYRDRKRIEERSDELRQAHNDCPGHGAKPFLPARM